MIACISFQYFLIAVAMRQQLQRRCSCTILVDGDETHSFVIAASPKAIKEGVAIGMTEREAAAQCPEGAILQHDAVAAEEMMGRVLEALEGFSPTLEVVEPGVVACDLGSEPGYATLEAEGKKMVAALEAEIAMVASVGIASSHFVARVTAQELRPGAVCVVELGEEAAALRDRSVRYLPLEKETARRLELLGMLTMGQLFDMPEGALVRQFGAEGARLAQLVRGLDQTPVDGIPYLDRPSAAADFSWAIAGGPPLLAELDRLVDQLTEEIARSAMLCSGIKATFLLEGGRRGSLTINFSSPMNDAERIKRLLASRLETVQFPGPVVAASLQAEGLLPMVARQLDMTSLFEATPQKRALQRVVERCKAKEHRGAVMHVVWDDPACRIPERIAHLQDYVDDDHRRGLQLPTPVQVATGEQGRPRMVKMRSGWKAVDSILESWDLDDEWWTPHPIIRVYHRLMLTNGGMLNVFFDKVSGGWYRQ